MECQYTSAEEVRRKKAFVIHFGSSRISDFFITNCCLHRFGCDEDILQTEGSFTLLGIFHW